MRTIVVLPTYNEGDNIEEVLRRIRAAAPAADVLVVDDSSPDGTAAKAEAVAAEMGQIKVLSRSAKDGYGRACITGFEQAIADGYEIVVGMDADLSHDPAALPQLIAGVEAGNDLVVGSRYIPGGAIPNWPWHRRLLSNAGNRYATTILHLPVHDATSGYRAYRAGMLADMDLDRIRASGYGFLTEFVYRVSSSGGRLAEVPIVFRDRERGTSKMSPRIIVEAVVLVTLWGVRDTLRRVARRVRSLRS
ncbi:MAG TPA: polyprenol monophosphomannose synthase [Acidimicrobiales bacterium]|jgi:dolichol-phosphate mannosyltransferase|nr:polyprenol monophosphomannose synthase [Acidimicrobiales bacterium]